MGRAPRHEECHQLTPEAFARTRSNRGWAWQTPHDWAFGRRERTTASDAFKSWLADRWDYATWRTVYVREYDPPRWLPIGIMCRLCRAFEEFKAAAVEVGST
jgi:hypothetical protein